MIQRHCSSLVDRDASEQSLLLPYQQRTLFLGSKYACFLRIEQTQSLYIARTGPIQFPVQGGHLVIDGNFLRIIVPVSL